MIISHTVAIAVAVSAACGLILAGLALVWRLHRHGGADAARTGQASFESDADRLIGELEEKYRQIDRRLRERLAELERLLARAEQAAQGIQTPAPERHDDGADSQPRKPSRQEEVLQLSSRGMNEIEIARMTGMDVGQVRLILHLCRTSSGRSDRSDKKDLPAGV